MHRERGRRSGNGISSGKIVLENGLLSGTRRMCQKSLGSWIIKWILSNRAWLFWWARIDVGWARIDVDPCNLCCL